MNRIIKFRAKSSIDEKWIYGLEKPDTNNPQEISLQAFWSLVAKTILDRKTVDQYANLNDKNDTEIYEGDILENKSIEIEKENWEELGCYWNDVVVFCKGMFTTKDDGLGCGESLWEIISDFKGNVSEVEVIGNIHETKNKR